jgi:hypothetical protein
MARRANAVRVANLDVGRPDVSPSTPAHVPRVKEGNEPGNYSSQVGHRPDGSSTARRSTGINAKARDPIDPRMPNLSPA